MSDKLRLGEILVRAGVLGREILEDALGRIDTETDLGELLIAEGHLDEGTLLQTIGKALNLSPVRLGDVQPDPKALALVDREDCAELFLFPVHVEQGRTGAHLHVAMANPADVRAIKRVTRKARMRIRPLVALAREVREAVVRHYGGAPLPAPALTSRPPAARSAELGSMEILDPGAPAESLERPVLFDFGVADLSSLDASLAPALPLPRAAAPQAPGTQSPLPIGDDLLAALDASAAEGLQGDTPPVSFDRARVASLRRSMPPTDPGGLPALGRIGSPPPRPAVTGPMPTPPRLPASAPLPPLGGGLLRAAPAGPMPLPGARHVPTDPFGPRPQVDSPPPLPAGLVDDSQGSANLQALFEQFTEPAEASEQPADEVIHEALARFGGVPPVPGERVFAALDRALLRAGSMSGRLTVVLIRQLARRGLVDADRLLADLKALS